MELEDIQKLFGDAVQCNSTNEFISRLKDTSFSDTAVRKKFASFSLVSIAKRVASRDTYYKDAVQLLNDLSHAKAQIDIAVYHEISLVEATSRLVLRAQRFVDETTIPCNEWPSTEDIYLELIQESKKLLDVEPKPITAPPYLLLRDSIQSCDALIMRVSDLGNQEYMGRVEKVYSRRFEGPQRYEDFPLKFVGSSGSWGNVTLNEGELALVFISYVRGSNRYYQRHWRGHFTLQEQNNLLYAVANWNLLEHGRQSWGPDYLADSAFVLDPAKTSQVAMPFAQLEIHLLDELSHVVQSQRK